MITVFTQIEASTLTRDRQVCFCAHSHCNLTKNKNYKKNNDHKFDCKIENLSRASGGGIHVLSSEKIITKKVYYKKKKLLQVLLQN